MKISKHGGFQRSILATLTALYVCGGASALAVPSMQPVAGGKLYEPTFTEADLLAEDAKRKAYLAGDIFVGPAGQVNSQLRPRTPQEVFQPIEGVTGVQQYIVQLSGEPVATYGGDLPGLKATKAPQTGLLMVKGRVDTQSSATQAYQSYLRDRQSTLVNQARQQGANIQIEKHLTLASNALVVEMTQEDAQILARQTGVTKITQSRVFELRTDRGPEFIGATSLWNGLLPNASLAVQGEGMVVGIVDTGINTDHAAFADDADYAQFNPLGTDQFIGDCEDEPILCNNKLIGVRSYPEITSVYAGPEFQDNPWGAPVMKRPANGEDYHGHGSHTASTVAGNRLENVPLQQANGEVTSDGVDMPFTFASTSGVAPRAHIVSYQVCWPGNGGDPYAGCPESAILSAFEDAIADGVDVINFSIGGAESFPWEDPMELAFLAAREAGISVAAAAGNAGSFWSADHASPWVTTVGAVSHDRVLDAGVKTLGDFGGARYVPSAPISGRSYSGSITGEVVLASSYDDPNPNDEYNAASCNAPFPAGTFTADQIVLCERGDIARVEKAENVAAGGAGGFILQNVDYRANNVVADKYVIPGIHVDMSARYKLRNWVRYNDPGTAIATISDYEDKYYFDETLANNLAPFSSMGPSKTNNTLVPDLSAPGVQIYAANADDQPFTAYPSASDWTFMSGTSMAAPHVAGAMTLLAQQHPDWTPAEIQSALMMTAGPVTLNTGTYLLEPFYHFMAGAGAIDVARAAETGLVMDETIENYRDANPNNGGVANWLNLPSMVEIECEQSCSFMRTVTATRDGQWEVESFAKETGFEVSVSPQSFQLSKGESQTLMVTAKVPGLTEYKVNPQEPGAPWSGTDNLNVFFNGELRLTETSGDSPKLHMPIVVASKADQMPVSLELSVTREQGSETLTMNTNSFSELTPRFYGPVVGTQGSATLEAVSSMLTPENIEAGWDIQMITIPEGTKRFVFEAMEGKQVSGADDYNARYRKSFPFVIMGLDINENNGFIPSEEATDTYAIGNEYRAELVCLSTSQAERNICSIEDPTPGNYWVATAMAYGEATVEVETGYAILAYGDDRGLLSVEGPASYDGHGDYPLTLNWDLPHAEPGTVWYGGMDLGAGPGAEGTFGFTALNIRRAEDAVNWSVSQDKARVGDVLSVSMNVAPNLESQERQYDLQLQLPQGMRLLTETVRANNPAVAEALMTSDSGITVQGVQASTRDVKREYRVTTNLDDAMCHTPLIDEYSTGGYIDLFGEFGMQPNAEWLQGDSRTNFDVPIDWLFYKQGAQFEVYNQANAGYMRMHTVGAMQFNTAYWSMSYHRGPGFLHEALAPFWRGSFEMKYRRHWEEPWGLTIASQYADERPDLGDLLFLEFDRVYDKYTGDEFDFQAILRSGIDDHPGMFEIIYAYDNLGSDVAKGTVFVEGFDSAWSMNAGPKEGQLYSVLGFDDLDTVLQDDLVVCMDYVGPEQSQLSISFDVAVQPEAIGQTGALTFDYQLQGGDAQTFSHEVQVNGNIKMMDLPDMTVDENGRIDGIEVFFVDADKAPNRVEVVGDNVTAEIEGNRFNLIPNAYFHGDTEVTVIVRDTLNSGDMASTSFMLTVESDGIALATITALDAKAVVEEGNILLSFTPDVAGEQGLDTATYMWTQVSGPQVTIEDAKVTEAPAGDYVFQLTYSVNGESMSTEASVTVAEPAPEVEEPAPEVEEPAPVSKSSSGSLGYLALLMLALTGWRRRQR
ncbi:S8 family serine peptidase [Ferrimonas gelatinilytica]|uniref:S8 family serine peptidase n=1 Tax=Ferrimonas gelatinilytica TaxID=1255257 RepID=A0ABP9S814_9GAMM